MKVTISTTNGSHAVDGEVYGIWAVTPSGGATPRCGEAAQALSCHSSVPPVWDDEEATP